MSRGRGSTTKMGFRTLELIFFTFFPQAFFHSEFDGDGVSHGLGHAKHENHKINLKNVNAWWNDDENDKNRLRSDFFPIIFPRDYVTPIL